MKIVLTISFKLESLSKSEGMTERDSHTTAAYSFWSIKPTHLNSAEESLQQVSSPECSKVRGRMHSTST